MSSKEFSQNGVVMKGLVSSFAMDRVLGWASPDIDVKGSGNLLEARDLLRNGVPHVVIANHLSNADGPVIKSIFDAYNFPDPVFIRGKRLDEQWFTRFMAGGVNGIPVWPETVIPRDEDENAARAAMNRNAVSAAQEVLRQGSPLVLFPEGTRSRDGKMRSASYKNARYLILEENTHILPVGLWETEQVFPIDRKFPTRGFNARLAAGRSVSVGELSTGLDLSEQGGQEELINRAMGLVASIIPGEYRGAYETKIHEL